MMLLRFMLILMLAIGLNNAGLLQDWQAYLFSCAAGLVWFLGFIPEKELKKESEDDINTRP